MRRSTLAEGWLVITCDSDEGFGVIRAIVAGLDDEIVAGFFAFLIKTTAEEPDSGMEEEEGFEKTLTDDNEVIEAAKVGEFVRENGDGLFLGQPAHEREGQDDHGAENSGDDRAANVL